VCTDHWCLSETVGPVRITRGTPFYHLVDSRINMSCVETDWKELGVDVRIILIFILKKWQGEGVYWII
jgi:hypothetical protein